MLATKDINIILQKKQSEKRFQHTLGVQHTAICLAMRYDEDLTKASYAGLLHDCAKHMSGEKLLEKCLAQHLPVSETERKNPCLLHGKYGAWLAENKFDVHDEDILDAIRYHTTGRPAMSLLEKIVFTADYIEPGRNNAPNLDELRKLAFIDLDMTVFRILEQTLSYLRNSSDEIDETTEQTYRYYKEYMNHGGQHGQI